MLGGDRTLWVVAALLLTASAYGLVNGLRWRAFQDRAIADARAEELERYAGAEQAIRDARGQKLPAFADPGNPDTAGRRRAPRYAVLPPGALAPLAVGQSGLLPGYFRVSTESRETILAATETENPTRLLTGRFDLAFVIVYLLPLLILAVSYSLLSAEQEQGTLALALSQPVTLRQLLGAKVAVRAFVLAAYLTLLATTILFVIGPSALGADGLLRTALWVGLAAAYGLFWFAVALAVAALGQSSAASATMVAGVWLVLTVLLPSALNLGVTTLYPVPSRVEMVQAVREASDAASEEGARLLGRYYQDHPELAADSNERAVNEFAVIRLAVDARVEEQVRPVLATYDRQIERQQRTVDWLRFASPAVLVHEALADLSGSGTARHRHFVAQVGRFHDEWKRYFQPRIARQAPLADYRDLPAFQHAEEPLRAVVLRVLQAFAGLGCAAALVLGWCAIRLRRFSTA